MERRVFVFLYDEHEVGNRSCPACFGRNPDRCRCEGLIHHELLDESEDGYVVIHMCDKCGLRQVEA